jgi:hypothetical protein
MKHDKIGAQHLERKAILYVRQSSAHQVLHNRESSTPLRANKSETIEWLKFTLEGVGERTHGYAFEDTAF